MEEETQDMPLENHSILVNPSLVIRKIYWRSVKIYWRSVKNGLPVPENFMLMEETCLEKNKVDHVVYQSGLNQLSSALWIKLLCRWLQQNWKLKAYNWQSCNSHI